MDSDLSLNQALSRWQSRKRLKNQIGLPEFSLTKYEKVCRFTIPFQENSIICVSTESNADILNIILKVQKIRDDYLSIHP